MAVTAASGADQPTLRDQLVDALEGIRFLSRRWTVPDLADALLPLIEAERERAKAEAAAEELDSLANEMCGVVRLARVPLGETGEKIRARAAALRATTGQPPDGTTR